MSLWFFDQFSTDGLVRIEIIATLRFCISKIDINNETVLDMESIILLFVIVMITDKVSVDAKTFLTAVHFDLSSYLIMILLNWHALE